MATADFKVKHGLAVAGNTTLDGTVSTTGLILSSTTSPVTLNASVGTSGQVLTSAGAGATPTWTTIAAGATTLDGLSDAVITTPAEGEILLYDGAGWINSPALGAREVFVATAAQTVFTTSNAYVVGSGQLSVYINGVKQYPATYTETSTTSFTLGDPAVVNDQVMAEISVLTSAYVQPPAVIALDELTDVVVTTPATNQVLTYNGTGWINSTSAIPVHYDTGPINLYGPAASIGGTQNIGLGNLVMQTVGAGNYNVALGHTAMSTLTDGYENVAVGHSALNVVTIGHNNVAVGSGSLAYNVTGAYNTAVGDAALYFAGGETEATNIVAGESYTIITVGTTDFTLIGAASNTVGVVFTASDVGTGTGTVCSNTDSNTAIGYEALLNNSCGGHNTAVGALALINNRSGYGNTAVGLEALGNTTAASGNTAVGRWAARDSTTGTLNTAVGDAAMMSNRVGTHNIAVGWNSMTWAGNTVDATTTITGEFYTIASVGTTDYTAIGAASNTVGVVFVATGIGTGNGTVFAHIWGNIGIGYQTLYGNDQGHENVAIGHSVLEGNTTGSGNVGVGSTALLVNTTGDFNVSIGWSSMSTNTTGNYNVAHGHQALYNNTTGSNNTAVGYQAGLSLTTGSNNTLIGGYAGTAGMAGNIVLSTGAGTVRLQHDGTNWTSATPISTTGLILPSTTSPITLNASVGTSGQVLTSAGTGATPSWTTVLPPGMIIDFGGSGSPAGGWLLCNGANVSRTTYADLFTAIGTKWGVGDGSTTFTLPNFATGDVALHTTTTANVGSDSTGEIKSHYHETYPAAWQTAGTAGSTIWAGNGSLTATNSTGGTRNKAAGKYVQKFIKT